MDQTGAPSIRLSSSISPAHVDAVRAFNRFYTQRIGILSPWQGSDLSLTEVRVLYELAHRNQPTASELAHDLSLDPGYLSRLLKKFGTLGWLARVPSPADARQNLLKLTDAGVKAFAPLEKQSVAAAGDLLAGMPPAGREAVTAAMAKVQRLVAQAGGNTPPPTAILRDPRPGDIGWVIQQHGEIYAREYGWNSDFEALVAGIASKFISNFMPEAEKCWIAELDDQRVGAAIVVRQSARTCKLRMLILTPEARGMGLGGRLTDECIAFARSKGYQKMQLWTNSCLEAARAIYKKRGFTLRHSEPYRAFGHDLVSETWELKL